MKIGTYDILLNYCCDNFIDECELCPTCGADLLPTLEVCLSFCEIEDELTYKIDNVFREDRSKITNKDLLTRIKDLVDKKYYYDLECHVNDIEHFVEDEDFTRCDGR